LTKLLFAQRAWEHYQFWQETDRKRLKKLNDLIKASMRTPFEGIGKPEPLMGEYSGFWSRRIDDEHRLVYRMQDGVLEIAQCRFHYNDH